MKRTLALLGVAGRASFSLEEITHRPVLADNWSIKGPHPQVQKQTGLEPLYEEDMEKVIEFHDEEHIFIGSKSMISTKAVAETTSGVAAVLQDDILRVDHRLSAHRS